MSKKGGVRLVEILQEYKPAKILLLLILCVATMAAVTDAMSVKTTVITMEITNLILDEKTISLSFPTFTKGTAAETVLYKVDTLSRPLKLHFKIGNTTAELAPYFVSLSFRITVRGVTGSYDQKIYTKYDGSTISEGMVTTSSSTRMYECKVYTEFQTKELAGKKKFSILCWAEEST
jgi:hypothetical protein